MSALSDKLAALAEEARHIANGLEHIAAQQQVEPVPVYRHKKRGTLYTVLGEAELQTVRIRPVDGSILTIYRGADGKLWARSKEEFHDGRFEPLPAAPEKDV